MTLKVAVATAPAMSLALPAGLSAIADRYDILLCDVWGVIHNGRERFPAACAALARFRERHGPVILISNSPRPSPHVVSQLDALGVPREAWSAFVTSGDATRAMLAARAPGPVWAIGPERDMPLYDGLGLGFAGPQDAAFVSVTGPVDDTAETPEDYRAALTLAAARGLPLICANPDRVVQRGDDLIYCGGALADLYAELGGQVSMAGKPYAPIYALCLEEAAKLGGVEVDRKRVLCVGDGVQTDIAGANGQDLACLFIAAGIHGAEAISPDGALHAPGVEAALAAKGAHADYAMAELIW